jgi:hypothetical protein
MKYSIEQEYPQAALGVLLRPEKFTLAFNKP